MYGRVYKETKKLENHQLQSNNPKQQDETTKMKISVPVFLASTISAVPIASKPQRRNSQELVVAVVEGAINSAVENIDQSSVVEGLQFETNEDFNDYMDSLSDMPDSEWEKLFDELKQTLEDNYGLSVDELENMTDEEFDSLIDSL